MKEMDGPHLSVGEEDGMEEGINGEDVEFYIF
jgi:hypothetical protein